MGKLIGALLIGGMVGGSVVLYKYLKVKYLVGLVITYFESRITATREVDLQGDPAVVLDIPMDNQKELEIVYNHAGDKRQYVVISPKFGKLVVTVYGQQVTTYWKNANGVVHTRRHVDMAEFLEHVKPWTEGV